ncbi:MAG: hypothetical protein ACRBFS_14300 [Aureispira sp.]
MKKLVLISIILIVGCTKIFGQEEQAILLPIPKDWRYEKIDLPMDFAPEMTHKGFEELRFGPGMFDATTASYFTYLFAVSFEETNKIEKKVLEKFLLQYYRGLCKAVAGSKDFSIDYTQIKVRLKKIKRSKGRAAHYLAELVFFDAFTNGQQIVLHMDLELTTDRAAQKTYLLALVSPQDKTQSIWAYLYKTKEELYQKGGFKITL